MADYVVNEIKWGSSTPGTSGGQVTWSFASLAGQIYNFDAVIANPSYQALIRAAFDAWEAVANIDFVEVSDSLNVDIRLGWDAIDGASGTVGEATSSYFVNPSGWDTFNFVEIRFDTAESWSTDPNYAALDLVNFFTTAVHEIGHAIGLGHSSVPDAIMYFATNTTINLTADDIAGVQAIYGAASTGGGFGGTPGNDTIQGTAGNDYITGQGGNDLIVGFGGNDTMFGGDGDDQLFAGAGDNGADVLYGGAGNDTLGGGAGNDTLVGGTGSDVLFGGAGDDWLDVGIHNTFTSDGPSVTGTAWAGAGNDRVEGDNTTDMLGGGAGNDLVRGYGGNDTLFGGADADTLEGGDNNDLLFGGMGNDSLSGEAGDDDLWGGAGDDTFVGGAGADLFGFISGSGSDRIIDFELGIDALDLSGTATDFTSAASVTAAASDTGAGLQIALGGGAIVVLAGLTVADIGSMDFVF